MAVSLAQRHGRRILASGALLMVAGIGGEALAAPHVTPRRTAVGAFALCGVLSLLLPRTAVSEGALTES